MSPTQWLLLVFLSVLWGGSFLFNAIAVQELPLLTLILSRVGIGALLLVGVVYAAGHRLPRRWSGWWPFLVMALLNNTIPFLLIVRGQKEIASGLASVLYATTPLFAVIIGHLSSGGDRADARRIAGVMIGIIGVAVLVGLDAMGGAKNSVFGMLCMLAAAFLYACAGLWGRRFKDVPLPVTAACPLLCATAILLPLALVFDQPWTLPAPSAATAWSVLGLGVLSTALGYMVFFRILAVSGAANSLLVTLLVPVSAMTLGAMILGETLLARHLAGALIIGTALLILDGRILRPLLRFTSRADQ